MNQIISLYKKQLEQMEQCKVPAICVICQKPFILTSEDDIKDPYPLFEEGVCCTKCNKLHIVPARFCLAELTRDNYRKARLKGNTTDLEED